MKWNFLAVIFKKIQVMKTPRKFLIFLETENLKKFLIFQEMELISLSLRKFLIFQLTETRKRSLYFSKQNFLIFQETELLFSYFEKRSIHNPSIFIIRSIFGTRSIFTILSNIYDGRANKRPFRSQPSKIYPKKFI